MTTAIGYKLAGGGVRYHHAGGEGMIRHAASAAINHLGHRLVDAIAHRVRGDGYKLTGEGRRRKPGRPRRVGRPRTKTHKVGRPRTKRTVHRK